jgi:iron complex transport system permease protein
VSRIDFGVRTSVVRRGRISFRFRMRTLVTCLVLLGATLAVSVLALCLGDLPLTPAEVFSAFLGQQSGIVETVVVEWRAPRTLAAALFGAALGVSGAIFQSLTRNPLASPDVIGVSAGSYTGGLVAIILLGGGSIATATGSIVGGLATAAVVYLLAYRRGIQGFRLIIVGIGVAAMLGAVSTYLLLRAKLEVAIVAATWGAGSLAPVGWNELLPSIAIIGVTFAALALLIAPMRQLELGDDAARSLGSRVEVSRVLLVVCGVALTAVVTAAAGPIAFVALAAPQIAHRIARTTGVTLVPSALLGALILSVSDVIAQHLIPGSLPVGLVTVVIGGGYLIWLLIHEARRQP